MSFEEERLASERETRIHERLSKYVAEIGGDLDPMKLADAVNRAIAEEDGRTNGELTYELDEEYQ